MFESRANEDHLLLTRIGFPTEEDLTGCIFAEYVYIDKLNDLQFKKSAFDNMKVDELITGKCNFGVFDNSLSNK